MGGPGTPSADYQFVTGIRQQSGVGKPGPLVGKESLEGGSVGALSQDLPAPLPLRGVGSGGEAAGGERPEAHTRCFKHPALIWTL